MSIKHSLLTLLRDHPSTASGLQERFAEEMSGLWQLNIGQVAQTLARLERDGLITTAGSTVGPTGRHAELYQLTAAGDEHLQQWWEGTVIKQGSERDELVIKLALAARRADVDLIALLDAQRFATLSALRQLNEQAKALPEDCSAPRLAIERRIFELESLTRWLDRVEALKGTQK